jgi:hypothetical protein
MKNDFTTKSVHSMALAAVLAAGMAAGLGGCRGDREDQPPRQFFPDLDDQLKWKPQAQSEFFSDGRTMRQQVPGAVAFGATSFAPNQMDADWAKVYADKRQDLLRADAAVYQGLDANGKAVTRIPLDVDASLLEVGHKKYNIYCSVCHGYLGDGLGQVGQQWATPVANFHEAKFKVPDPKNPGDLWTDGHIFRTGMFGLYDASGAQKMPGYSHALSARDCWGIVAYIRALQTSREATMNDVPEAARAELEKSKAAAIEAAERAAAASAPAPAAPAAVPAKAPAAGGSK